MLNATYEPLSVVPSRRAACLVLADKADIIEDDGTHLHSESLSRAESRGDPAAVRRQGAVPPPHRDVAPCRVRPRRALLPVLRQHGRLDRPHHAEVTRRSAHLGERRRGMPAVQPSQARPHARRSRHATGPAAHAPRRNWPGSRCRSTVCRRPGSRISRSPADDAVVARPTRRRRCRGVPRSRAAAPPTSRDLLQRQTAPTLVLGSSQRDESVDAGQRLDRASTSSAGVRVVVACCCGPASSSGSISRSRRRRAVERRRRPVDVVGGRVWRCGARRRRAAAPSCTWAAAAYPVVG